MEVVMCMVVFVLGVVCGITVQALRNKPKTKGTLRIYNDPDDGPYLFLELTSDPNDVMKEKFVTFDVNPRDYISQK